MNKKKLFISIVIAILCVGIIFVIVIKSIGIYDFWLYGKDFFINNNQYSLNSYCYKNEIKFDMDFENPKNYEYYDDFYLKIDDYNKNNNILNIRFQIKSKLFFCNCKIVKAYSDNVNEEKYLQVVAVIDEIPYNLTQRAADNPNKSTVSYSYNLNCDELINSKNITLVFKDLMVNEYVRK